MNRLQESGVVFRDFKNACEQREVIIMRAAKFDASTYFNLNSEEAILDFIANDGLEELKFINEKPWEKNPDRSRNVSVYAFEFRTDMILGYVAFFKNSEKWILKSFHLSESRNTSLGEQLCKVLKK